MSIYSGKAAIVNRSVDELYNKINDFGAFQSRIDELPDEVRQRLEAVRFEDDKMIINAPGMGEVALGIVERQAPSLMRLSALNSPIPFNIIMNFAAVDDATSTIQTDIDAEIPMMLRPFVGNKLQEGADRIGEMISNIFH